MMFHVTLLLSSVSCVIANFNCLCSYNGEAPVMNGPTTPSTHIGTLYEFDCKPIIKDGGVHNPQWATIAFEHQKAFVKLSSGLMFQTCVGNPDENDLVTTSIPRTTRFMVPTSPTISTWITNTTNRPTELTTNETNTKQRSSSLFQQTTAASIVSRLSTKVEKQSSSSVAISSSTPTILISSEASSEATKITTKYTTTITSAALNTMLYLTTSSSKVNQPTTKYAHTTVSNTTSITTQNQTSSHAQMTMFVSPSTSVSHMSASSDNLTTKQPTTAQSATRPNGISGSGSISMCSSTVRQYAQQDNEILVQHGSSCYTIVPHRVSWRHAESICNHRGGHLFHVSSAADNNYMTNLLSTRFNHSVWMGLNDIGQEGQFTWVSGNPVTYTNWYPNRKDNFYSHNVEDCTVFVPYLNNGQWDDIPCGSTSTSSIVESMYETHYFVCQFPTSIPTLVSSGNTNLCPASVKFYAQRDRATLAQYGTSCYEWVNARASWSHAESNCRHRGGHLVQINDAQEEAFVQKFMQSHDSKHAVWIGLHDQGHEEIFKWTSGESVSYTNWVPGRKSNFQSHDTEDCVVLVPFKQGMWDDISCGSSSLFFGDRGETHPYMCEFNFMQVSTFHQGMLGV